MQKSTKLLIALLVIVISTTIVPIYAQCGKCLENPESCKLLAGDKKITVEKKIVVMPPAIDRGFIGVMTKETDKGLVITKVVPESPAEKAGLKVNDIILQVKAKPVKTQDELIDILKGTKPKDTVSLKIKSGDKEKTVDIELAKVPAQEMKIMPEMPMTPKEKEMEKEFMLMPPKETRGFLGVVTEEEDGNLVIEQVVANSPAQRIGLMEEDIISEVNGMPVSTPSGLVEILKGTKPGDIVHLKIISGRNEKVMDVELGAPPTQPQMKMRVKYGGKTGGIGAGYFGPGFMFFDYDDINNIFTIHNLPRIKDKQFAFSGGGWGQAGRIRLGGFGIGGSQVVSNDSLHVEASYGVGFFEMGYTVVNGKHFRLSPLVGIGGGGITMKIKSLTYNPTNFNAVLDNPCGIAKLTKGGLTMFPGLAIDIPIGFVGLSFKGGYLWTPAQGSWKLEDYDVINGPDLDLKGPFATLSIMFSGGR